MPKIKISTSKGDVTIHTPNKNDSQKDLYLPDEKIEKIVDEIEKDESLKEQQISEFKNALQKALAEGESIQGKNLLDEVMADAASTKEFSDMLKADGSDGVENAAMLGRVLGEIITSERTGVEPNFEDFLPKPSPMMERAINDYLSREDNPEDSLAARLERIKLLFYPNDVQKQKVNENYRILCRRGRYSFADDYLDSSSLFFKLKNPDKSFNQDEIIKEIRRLDIELNEMERIDKEEIILEFAEQILSMHVDFQSLGRYFDFFERDYASLSKKSKNILRDVILIYQLAMKHHAAYREGYGYVRDFSGDKIDRIINLAKDNYPYAISGPDEPSVRYIRKEEYHDILALSKALYNALPSGFQDTVEAATWLTAGLRLDIGNVMISSSIALASKEMRNAFIAITQGRGTFENFVKEVFNYYGKLNMELNHRINVAANLVGLYESLKLDIALELEASRRRLLMDLPF